MIATLFAIPFIAATLPQQIEQMRVRPTTEAQAVAEFETVCVQGLYHFDALKNAVATSRRGYTMVAGSPGGWRNWTSPYGSVHFLGTASPQAKLAPQCNLVSFTRAPVKRGALEVALRAMAKRQAGLRYSELRETGGRAWSWRNERGLPMTAEVALDRRMPQQLVLVLHPVPVTATY